MMTPAGKTTEMVGARVRDAVGMDPRIPAQRAWGMIWTTLWGVIIGGAGLWLTIAAVTGYQKTDVLPTWLFAGGLLLFGAGCNIASKQLLAKGLLSLRAPLTMLRDLKHGKPSAGEPAADIDETGG